MDIFSAILNITQWNSENIVLKSPSMNITASMRVWLREVDSQCTSISGCSSDFPTKRAGLNFASHTALLFIYFCLKYS